MSNMRNIIIISSIKACMQGCMEPWRSEGLAEGRELVAWSETGLVMN
jgi:hypothetical protein